MIETFFPTGATVLEEIRALQVLHEETWNCRPLRIRLGTETSKALVEELTLHYGAPAAVSMKDFMYPFMLYGSFIFLSTE